MNLHSQLRAREEAGEPVRVGVIGAGKFAGMFLAQARRTPGVHVLGIADLAASSVWSMASPHSRYVCSSPRSAACVNWPSATAARFQYAF